MTQGEGKELWANATGSKVIFSPRWPATATSKKVCFWCGKILSGSYRKGESPSKQTCTGWCLVCVKGATTPHTTSLSSFST